MLEQAKRAVREKCLRYVLRCGGKSTTRSENWGERGVSSGTPLSSSASLLVTSLTLTGGEPPSLLRSKRRQPPSIPESLAPQWLLKLDAYLHSSRDRRSAREQIIRQSHASFQVGGWVHRPYDAAKRLPRLRSLSRIRTKRTASPM